MAITGQFLRPSAIRLIPAPGRPSHPDRTTMHPTHLTCENCTISVLSSKRKPFQLSPDKQQGLSHAGWQWLETLASERQEADIDAVSPDRNECKAGCSWGHVQKAFALHLSRRSHIVR